MTMQLDPVQQFREELTVEKGLSPKDVEKVMQALETLLERLWWVADNG